MTDKPIAREWQLRATQRLAVRTLRKYNAEQEVEGGSMYQMEVHANDYL